MTIQSIIPFLYWPAYESFVIGSYATVDLSSGQKAAFVVHAPKTGNIDRIVWQLFYAVGSPSVDVRIETISSGKPSGTLWATSTNATVSSGTSSTIYETTLGASASVNVGDTIAIVFSVTGGTSASIGLYNAGVFMTAGFPSVYTDTGSGYTTVYNRSPIMGLRYSDTTYTKPIGCFVTSTVSISDYYSSGEQGIRFKIPYKARVTGVWHALDPDGDIVFRLLADSTAPAGTAIISKTQPMNEFRFNDYNTFYVAQFTDSATLDADTWYRLTAKVTSGSLRYNYSDFPSSYPTLSLGGENLYLTVDNGSSWTNTTTRQPMMGIIIDGLDDGAGGGGVSGFPLSRVVN